MSERMEVCFLQTEVEKLEKKLRQMEAEKRVLQEIVAAILIGIRSNQSAEQMVTA
jgi:hypothetical protein